MITELKILFENIRHFRQLLTEGVSDKTIVDAINNHEFLYIYYQGETTKETGYRTIRPFVLGTNTSGNLALRAWQDKGRSDSLRPDAPRIKRKGHEYDVDHDGVTKPAWRLFLVDNITSNGTKIGILFCLFLFNISLVVIIISPTIAILFLIMLYFLSS